MEDAEVAKYVGLVLTWQLRFALNEAVVHRSVPHVLRNLQFGAKNFNAAPTALTKLTPADVGFSSSNLSLFCF